MTVYAPGGRTPSGPAGGSLTGTYPNPSIANGVITDSNVAPANKDGLYNVPSLRTLGSGSQQAGMGILTLAGLNKLQPGVWTGSPNIGTVNYTPGSNLVTASPLYVGSNTSLSLIGVQVVTAGSTGAVIRLGIYNDNGSFFPNNLIVDAGTIDATLTGVMTLPITVTLTPGLYWLASAVQGSPATIPVVLGINGFGGAAINGTSNFNAASNGYYYNGVPGALPPTWGGTIPNGVGTMARVCVRI